MLRERLPPKLLHDPLQREPEPPLALHGQPKISLPKGPSNNKAQARHRLGHPLLPQPLLPRFHIAARLPVAHLPFHPGNVPLLQLRFVLPSDPLLDFAGDGEFAFVASEGETFEDWVEYCGGWAFGVLFGRDFDLCG